MKGSKPDLLYGHPSIGATSPNIIKQEAGAVVHSNISKANCEIRQT
jgi:hypothetical protein